MDEKSVAGYLLLLEAATERCSVALATTSGKMVAEIQVWEKNRQSELLAPMADHLLQMIPEGEAIEGVAVTSGPGSYTGLRIGAAYAKGLCYALRTPLYVTPTTEVMAQNFIDDYKELPDDALLMPMIDARRMEVYGAIYTRSGEALTEIGAWVLTEESFKKELQALVGDRVLYYFGSGADKAEELFSNLLAKPIFTRSYYPKASGLLRPTLQQKDAGSAVDLAYWEPFYLKEYQATISRNKLLG